MKTFITGASGMLGEALRAALLNQTGSSVYATDIDASQGDITFLDISDAAQVESLISYFKPEIVFHLAAETDVDKCELEPVHAFRVNASGVKNVALSCKKNNCIMVYISTAAVFDGKKPRPYVESDIPNPINVYGKSKLEGERAVKSLLKRYYIIRAGWLMGGGKKDKKFVGKMINLLSTKNIVKAVTDKIGSPTYVKDLSGAIIELAATERYGLYHLANKGSCSRYEIAKKILEFMGKNDTSIEAVASDCFSFVADKPDNEAIESSIIDSLGICKMRSWTEALKEYMESWNSL